jgi:hypothetical protein
MRRVLAVAALLLAAAPAASADDDAASWLTALRLRARAAEDVAYRLHDPGDVAKLRTTGWLDAKYTFSDTATLRLAARAWYDAVFEATGRYPANVERDQETDVSLREAVLALSSGDGDVRIGRQQIVWGEAIGTFITDVVNPKDFREFILPDFSEIRLPIWAVDATYRLATNVTLEGVWTPDTRFNKLGKRGAEFEFAAPAYRFQGPVVRLPDDADEFSVERSEGGARLSALHRGWDASLIYYDQADKTPVLRQRRAPQAAGPELILLQPTHPRVRIVGATLAKSLDEVVFRGEAAVTVGKQYETVDLRDRDGVVRRDTIDYLVGVDATVLDVSTSLQVSQKILTGSVHDLARGGVEGVVTTSVALRLSRPFVDDTLVPGVLFVINANRADFRVSPRIDWLVTGAVTVSLGADVFEGPRRTLYGQFDRNDRVYVTTSWRF